MRLHLQFCLFLLLSLQINAYAQTDLSVDLVNIKNEGFLHSKVMENLIYLSDVYGQRLTGSREYFRSAQWTKAKLQEYKLDNVHFEEFCEDCRGWSLKSFNVEMTAPYYLNLLAYPLAMVKGIEEVSGTPIHIPSSNNMESVKKEFAGKLKGKIVLLGKLPRAKNLTDPLVNRQSSDQLGELANGIAPTKTQIELPELLESFEDDRSDQEFLQFIESEGALALFTTTSLSPGIIHADGTYYFRDSHMKPLPCFALAPEHFGKILRMLSKEETPMIKIKLDVEFYMEKQNNVNVIGEITGSDPKLKSEVVMLGAHFDSWHSGSGTTDNGAGVAVMMEVLRILKASGVKPKRTIRIGLWGGEEQAYVGSVAYAQSHFGDFKSKFLPETDKVSAYLNMDNGAGAMRGIYLQGNEFARDIFRDVLKPFEYLGASTITIENTFSTDHDVFDYYNIPSFQIIQDNLGYQSLTHHTHLDLIEYAPEDDLKKNSVILASVAYQLAMRDRMVPRKRK